MLINNAVRYYIFIHFSKYYIHFFLNIELYNRSRRGEGANAGGKVVRV